jgi:hypothetical protein
VLGALFYLIALAVTGGVIAAVGLWLMPLVETHAAVGREAR